MVTSRKSIRKQRSKRKMIGRKSKRKMIGGKKNTTLRKVNCAANYRPNEYSCYRDDHLQKLKEEWNAYYKNNKGMRITKDNPYEIWLELAKKLEKNCKTEACWLKQNEFKKLDMQFEDVFAPMMPKAWLRDMTTWLSSTDILKVMRQHVKKDKEFMFIGPTAIDYDAKENGRCVSMELCNFDLSKYIKNGIKHIGIIFNTDMHTGSGIHWFAVYMNIDRENRKLKLEYYDSASGEKPNEVKRLFAKIREQAKEEGVRMLEEEKEGEDQRGESECGMYAMTYIIRRKLGYKKEGIVRDREMLERRKEYYNAEI